MRSLEEKGRTGCFYDGRGEGTKLGPAARRRGEGHMSYYVVWVKFDARMQQLEIVNLDHQISGAKMLTFPPPPHLSHTHSFLTRLEPGAQLDILLRGGNREILVLPPPLNIFRGGEEKCVLYSNNL